MLEIGIKIAKKFKRVLKRFLGLSNNKVHNTPTKSLPLHVSISNEQCRDIKNAVKLSFIGDLILLREMVETAWEQDNKEYTFNHMFDSVRDILQTSNLTVGVLEGPLAGDQLSYSTSNFDDNIPLRLNFPDSFAKAIYDAGINIVSLANNHIYDCGKNGLLRTLNVLDDIGINHVGGYRNSIEKHSIFYCDVNNIKIAILAFTYCPNGVSDNFFYDEKTKDLTTGIVPPDSPFIEQCKIEVMNSIRNAKENNPDLLIAMPHMGTQFSAKPDQMQRFWVKFLAEAGVDIILGDHSHHVQPIEWIETRNASKTLVVYCPGNFVNSYLDYEGDLSMLVNVYISPADKKPFAVGCVPLYALADEKNRYQAVPFYKLFNGDVHLSYNERKHVSKLHNIFSSVLLGVNLTIDQVQEEYFLYENSGYLRNKVPAISAEKDNWLLQLIQNSESICFMGDSITEGTLNGGYGWYEPIMVSYPMKNINVIAKGGATSKTILELLQEKDTLRYDLYVIAIGCNDIRYRDKSICAMSSTEYVNNLAEISKILLSQNDQARLVFVSPWESADFDPYCCVSFEDKSALYVEYTNQLSHWCMKNNFYFINPNSYIKDLTNNFKNTEMLKDYIHPNARDGIFLYSQAVLNANDYGKDTFEEIV